MPSFDDLVKKAFYLGVGVASYAQEKAGATINELRSQAQKLADEMIARGELSTEEARKFVDDLVRQAQQDSVNPAKDETQPKQPRQIEILSDEEDNNQDNSKQKVDSLREQVESLQAELRRLKQE
jgi:polyhydroxyalkanoate synthesis regulator phasin